MIDEGCRCAKASVAAVLALCLVPLGEAGAQWPPGSQRGSGPWPAVNPAQRWRTELAHADGFLFVGDTYVPLPCEMAIEDESLTVNGTIVQSLPPAIPGGNRGFGGPGRPARPEAEARRLGNEIVENLVAGQLVVALPNVPVIIAARGAGQHELLQAIVSDSARTVPVSLSGRLPPEHSQALSAWLASFEPPAELRERASGVIAEYEQREAENASAIAAARRLNLFSYPLSMVGMVVTTLGIGHLLTHRPPVDVKSLETDASPLAVRVLTYSLALVVIYSALDLAWTILAHQAGQMLELNPIGSHLIDNPLHLSAFKAGATGLAVGLLFVLRKYRKAQLAAWWVCLVCTLLTARWLTLSSMMAA